MPENKKPKKKKSFTNTQNGSMQKAAHIPNNQFTQPKAITSLLDNMVDGREFESLAQNPIVTIDLVSETRRSIEEIQSIRKRPLICYMANMVNPKLTAPRAIDDNDDLPFSEMISSIPEHIKEIDIIIVTPGGSGQQVARFVDKLRPRFDKVTFILPNMAMSAGTIFVMSGDEIIMDSRSYIGPIDPQIPNKNGIFVPAQAILTIIEDIQKRGEEHLANGQNPPWTDLQILNQIEAKEIGSALSYSDYSIELVETYLYKYKFKDWTHHSSDCRTVTDEDKKQRAKEIATLLCNHKLWKSHSRGINRDIAWETCRLKIEHPENTEGLSRSLRRFWALFYWIFENTAVFKVFTSENYAIFRSDSTLLKSN